MSGQGATGGELLALALDQAGVSHCFGVPGESYLGLLDALVDAPVRFVSARHEGGASFMACGYARASGRLGVCLGTRAVGSANLSIGIHNAYQDSTPMLAIAGQVNRAFRGREAFQEVDLVAMMRPLTKWAVEVDRVELLPEILAKAVHLATAGRPGPVFLALPQDLFDERGDLVLPAPTPLGAPFPEPAALDRLLAVLLGANDAVIFAGGGVGSSPGGRAALVAFAEATELPVITDWRHHDLFPNDHRLFLGCRSLGSPPSVNERLARAGVVLALGNRMQENSTDGYRYPLPTSRLLQVDIEPAVLVNHRSPELALVADAGATLHALLARVADEPAGLAARRERNREDRRRFEAESTLPPPVSGEGLSYAHVLATMARRLAPESVLVSDAGNFYGWFARYWRFNSPGSYLGPASGAMGFGLPAAIGARIAQPGRPVVSLSGDGGFLMSFAELETAVREQVKVLALVFDNERHGTIRMHQQRAHPGRVVATELGRTDLSLVARGLGAEGFLVTEDADFEEVFDHALATEGPCVVHLRMDRRQLSVLQRLED